MTRSNTKDSGGGSTESSRGKSLTGFVILLIVTLLLTLWVNNDPAGFEAQMAQIGLERVEYISK